MIGGLFFHIILAGFLLLVIYYDVTRYIIPNWLSALILLLYPLFVVYGLVLVTPPLDDINWPIALGMGGVFLVVGFLLYLFKLFGAGDAKLLAVCAVWAGQDKALDLIFLTAIYGGIMSLFLIVARKGLPMFLPALSTSDKWPEVLKPGAAVPYGLAIAAAMLTLLGWHGMPGLAPLF